MDTRNNIRLNHLDLYKGICILFILLTHHRWSAGQRLAYLFPFWIDMAVPVFMVITGYVSAMSFHRRRTVFSEAYRPREIFVKWLRFIIPFTPVYLCEVLVYRLAAGKHYDLLTLLKDYLVGGYGQGSYYFPVMLQVVLILPLIWYLVKRFEGRGLLLCFAFNVLFESVKTAVRLSPELYRLCSLRYVFVLAYGCYLYVTKEKLGKSIVPFLAGLLGIVYIVACSYLSYQPIITEQWKTTSVFAALYLVPILQFLMKQTRLHCRGLELLGQASFNIFLAQMAYYLFGAPLIYTLTNSGFLQILIHLLICCGAGLLFYKIESPITKRITQAIKAKQT